MNNYAKTASFAAIGVFSLSMFALATQEGTAPPLSRAERLTDLLPIDTIVELRSFGDKYVVYIVSKKRAIDYSRDVTTLLRAIRTEEAKDFPDSEAIERATSRLNNKQTHWKVIESKPTFVRLEQFVHITGREHVEWIAIPESTIQMVKQRTS